MTFFLFICCFFFPIPNCLFAQEEQKTEEVGPEELIFTEIPVVTAGKRVHKRSEAPASIVVITAEDIKNSGARTIAEAIQFRSGVNVIGLSGTDIRGVGGGGRILLLVDGRRANDVFTGGFEDGFERPLTAVERIELIKGPASSLYGTNAFAGIINIITKKVTAPMELDFTAAGGNFSTQNYEALWQSDKGGIDSLITFSAHSDEGNDLVGPNDEVRAFELFGKAAKNGFTFSAGYRPNRRGIPGLGNTTSSIKRNDSFGHVQYERVLNDKWNVFSQFYLQNEYLFLNDPTENLDIHDLRIEGEARANYRFSDADDIIFGVELRHDRTNNFKSSGTEQYTSSNNSFYADNELHITRHLILSAGIRWDDNSIFGNSFNPKAGIVALVSNDTTVKAFVGKAFRGPEFLDLFTDVRLGSFTIEHNPLLNPENVISVEGEVSHRITNWLDGRFDAYHNSLHDLITARLQDSTIGFVNLGKASTDGIEYGLRGTIGKDVTFFANHTIQFANDETNDTRLPLIPRNTVNASLSFHKKQDFTVSWFGKYVGPRPTTNLLTGRPIDLSGYFKCDVVWSSSITDHLELSAAIYNLFNVHYERSLGSPQNGIQALVGFRYQVW